MGAGISGNEVGQTVATSRMTRGHRSADRRRRPEPLGYAAAVAAHPQLDTFDPLDVSPDDPVAAIHYARNRVKNIVESYHGRFDALAEGVQNAIDAIEARWRDWDGKGPLDAATPAEERPTLRIRIHSDTNLVEFIDNGVGIAQPDVVDSLIPNVSPKGASAAATRGHKGVGTTFLAYGHHRFTIHTKNYDGGTPSDIAYTLADGVDWVHSDAHAPAPRFTRIDPPTTDLDQWSSGTYVAITAGPKTTMGNARVQYNKFEHWELILRTYTAVGYVSLPTSTPEMPPWLAQLNVELSLSGVPATRTAPIKPRFPYPHELARTKDVRELRWLQNHPGDEREFRLIYVDRSHAQLSDLLSEELGALKASEEGEKQLLAELFDRYEIAAYASIAYENTFYDELNRTHLAEDAKIGVNSNLNGGVLVCSVHMPIGELHTHLRGGIRPELKRRFFLLVYFNDKYSPDIGRKTIPRRDELLVAWIEDVIRAILERQAVRLIKDKDDTTRGGADYQQVKEELAEGIRKLKERAASSVITGHDLVVPFPAAHEDEVIMNFAGLIADGSLPGYRLVGVPGNSTRYDGLFSFTAAAPDAGSGGVPLGIEARRFKKDGTYQLTDRWLEFKRNLEDLLADFDAEDGSPSKKYFDLLDLAVVWSVKPGPSGKYEVGTYDENNWFNRSFYGATHYITTSGSNHRIDVIESSSFIAGLAAPDAT
jgi:hypothetical protein